MSPKTKTSSRVSRSPKTKSSSSVSRSPKTKPNSCVSRSPRSSSNSSRKRKREEPLGRSSDSRKRKNEKCTDKPSKIATGLISDDQKDFYCWLCHGVRCELNCTYCPRSFHISCLEKEGLAMSETSSCPECLHDGVDFANFSTSLSTTQVKEMLNMITVRRLNKKQYKNGIFVSFQPELKSPEIVNVVDLKMLIDSTQETALGFKTYTKPAEFFSDVKWIYHNCCILYGDDSAEAKTASSLLKEFKQDLSDFEACPECYYHMYSSKSKEIDFFVRICERPHDIIWAQVTGYPYWPAKCLKVINGKVHVRFFGKHEASAVRINQCYYISKEYPNPRKVPKSAKYNIAQEELKKYVQLYEKKFGKNTFSYSETCKPYLTENPIQIAETSTVTDININSAESCAPLQPAPLFIDFSGSDEQEQRRIFSSGHPLTFDLQFSTDEYMNAERGVLSSEARSFSSPVETTNVNQGVEDFVICTNAVGESTHVSITEENAHENDDETVMILDSNHTNRNASLYTTFPNPNRYSEVLKKCLTSPQRTVYNTVRRDMIKMVDHLFFQVGTSLQNSPVSVNNVAEDFEALKDLHQEMMDLSFENLVHHKKELSHKKKIKEYQDTIERLNESVAEADKKFEILNAQLADTTRNARMIVNNIKNATDQYWHDMIGKHKDNFTCQLEEKLKLCSDRAERSELCKIIRKALIKEREDGELYDDLDALIATVQCSSSEVVHE